MGGILLYILTLLLELISVLVRFAMVSGVVGLFAGSTAGIVAGAVAGLSPIAYSIIVLAGMPSGHILVRRSLGARPLSRTEQAKLYTATTAMRSHNVPMPRKIFAVDEAGLNAAISGRTLYIYRELFDSPYLPGVVAHELGHFNSLDGRLLLAIRALTLPGGFVFAYLLLSILRWVAYGLSTVLVAMLVVLFALFGLRLGAITGALLGVTIQLLRMAIIFAVGGVGPSLLGSIWRSYLVEREFAADAYAARLGYGHHLVAFFETEVLDDVRIPWYEQPTHPTAMRRVANLLHHAARHPQAAAFGPRSYYTQPASSASPPRQPHTTTAPVGAATSTLGSARTRSQVWIITIAVAFLIVLAGAFFVGSLRGSPRDSDRPTPGPTPTLGVPSG